MQEIERRLREIDREKGALVYDWLEANGLKGNYAHLDWKRGEKATAERRRALSAEQKTLRAERKARTEAYRAARQTHLNAARTERETRRFVVTAECQICENRQCTNSIGRMVHHGYQRPGIGFILGDCYGVDRLPYPAVDALREWLKIASENERGIIAAIDRLDSRTELYGSVPGQAVIRKAEVPESTWNRRLEYEKARLDSERRWWAAEATRAVGRIAAAEKVGSNA